MQKKDSRSFNSQTMQLLNSFGKKFFEAPQKYQIIKEADDSFRSQSAFSYIEE